MYLPVRILQATRPARCARTASRASRHATGRIELWSTFYNAAELDPLPYFEEPEPGPTSTPELFEKYPLVLTTGARRWSYFHSEHRQVERLRKMHPDPTVQVHPDMLKQLDMVDGEWVWIENQNGRAKIRIEETPILSDPRIVACDHAWWRPEGDPEKFFDVFEYNINNLMIYDPRQERLRLQLQDQHLPALQA